MFNKISLTYRGVFLVVLGYAFVAAGVPFVEADAEKAITWLVSAAGVFYTLWGRLRLGGINILGLRVP